MNLFQHSNDFSERMFLPKDGLPSDMEGPPRYGQRSLIGIDNLKRQHSAIQELEVNVSRLQTADNGLDEIFDILKGLVDFLDVEVAFTPQATIPNSVVNNFITEQLANIRKQCTETTFSGKRLLNGDSGVIGKTSGVGLQYVRGSALVRSSSNKGYDIQVTRLPKASLLIGNEKLNPDVIKKERRFVIKTPQKEICYEFRPGENPNSLIYNLQYLLNKNGLDISVFRSKNNYLILRHNEMGDHTQFTGQSHKTALISRFPGELEHSLPGQNIAGFINGETAYGMGGYLIGASGNKTTDGLVLFYNGTVRQVGDIVGKVFIRQQGIAVPISIDQTEIDTISLPDMRPEQLAVGVANNCGFMNLSMIRSNNDFEKMESIKLIQYAMDDLKDLQAELKRKENHYIELAISLLKNPVKKSTAGDNLLSCSSNKAIEMAEQIKLMLNTQTLGLL